MPPLSLSDQELEIVMRAAGPLPAQDRSRFLEAVIAELAHYSRDEIGEGSIARVAHTLQRQFWNPPAVELHAPPKYSRRAIWQRG